MEVPSGRLYAMERGLKIPQNKCTKTTNSLLISLMKQLEKLEQKQKYAAWKAADIRKAVKEGRKPQVGPPAACLPTLATIPIWIGLYQALSNVANEIKEAEFLKGLNMLTSLRHENLVKLRGFCCSSGRGECFLIYEFIPIGSLLRYLDVKEGDSNVLEWSITRVSIVKGNA